MTRRSTKRSMVDAVDQALVEQAQRGDRDAFAVLVRTHGDRLFGIARRMLRDFDLADDAVQQTFVSVWRELPSLRDPARFEGWSTRILVRVCFDTSRTTRRTALRTVPMDQSLEPSMADGSEAYAQRDLLERGFRRLPAEQRAILVLRHYVGMEPTEIASVLGVPPGTVRSRLHYAHRELRSALEADARLGHTERRPA